MLLGTILSRRALSSAEMELYCCKTESRSWMSFLALSIAERYWLFVACIESRTVICPAVYVKYMPAARTMRMSAVTFLFI